ncbi:hypothetical protein LTR99_001951 [Exophiala xenobiotica]|uniref:HPP transmembrane region domain-containing protein n=1 Tax=Vermiconidia calcicola TaxID=1690605 RepID=A0AAV9QB97_9PEZI|nr:hypothetical protein LTR96_002190 [Exophiala xenobiotica]KAK5536719.1 hypothetical protein LTR25_005393 [Vermiconidia calcicola]KAK5306261.1 hypothetical protein LTR99_001951 [Exophiala xenobiotica]KAK5329710.1 hypothetical protein LTR93_001297 [Exophiala xenobiotica]KAK5416646.1 hypothetical protein LTR06_002631 [Exophiala xenobiotica]
MSPSISKHLSKPGRPFDIDNYLNPFIPRNPTYLLPTWLSFWFGYRAPRSSPTPAPSHHPFHTLTLYLSVTIGAFCGVAIIESVFRALPPLSGHVVPIIIASFGAAAILEYNTVESPLSQPRNLVFGHFLSATVAVGITKLFQHLPPNRFDDLRWLAGALAVGLASAIMSFTKTVHPPAGATALLAATNVDVQEMGWWLLPLVLLAAMLMLASALVLNNIAGRRFPVYWWTPVDLKALREERRKEREGEGEGDVEKGVGRSGSGGEGEGEGISDADTEMGSNGNADDLRKHESGATRSSRRSRSVSITSGSRVPHRLSLDESRSKTQQKGKNDNNRILITKDEIITPDWFDLNDWEDEVLRILMERLRDKVSDVHL